MTFSVDKCRVIHFGSETVTILTYYMAGNPLQAVKEESDLGVTISSDLKHANHCKNAQNKANTMLGVISRNFEYKTPVVML